MAGHYEQSANDVVCIVGAIPIDSGFAPDTFITVDYLTDAFVDVVGALGDTCASKTNDDRALVELTLMSSAPINAVLAALHELDKKTPNGAGLGPLLIKDAAGTTLHAASKSRIIRSPKWERGGGESKTVTWQIRAYNMQSFVGGNG